MRFERMNKDYVFVDSGRKRAAVKRKHQRIVDSMPLFADEIKESLNSVDEADIIIASSSI